MQHEGHLRKTVCVIGGGLTGLTAAYQLADQGYKVILLESSLQLGGMVASVSWGKQPVEYIYHHLFTSDTYFLELCRKLKIEDKITWHQTKDAIYTRKSMYPFSGPADLLRYRPLPLAARIRTGLAVLKAGRLNNWQSLEKLTARAWLISQAGQDSYQKLWQPLLQSKFDQDENTVSAVWIWNKFKLRGHSRKNKVSASRLGYMRGGFTVLIDALKNQIETLGGTIHKGRTAVGIRYHQDRDQMIFSQVSDASQQASAAGFVRNEGVSPKKGYIVSAIHDDGMLSEYEVDGVITTVSARQFANMATSLNLPDDYLKKAQSVRYKADLCLILHLRHSLSPFYWTTICDRLPFVVVVEHTRLTGTKPYDGVIVYVSRYLDVTDPLWSMSDGSIYQVFTKSLKQVYPHFSLSDVIHWRLCRTHYAQPVIDCAYSDKMPTMDTPSPGVKLAGMAQIYPEDRGMNYAIRLAGQAVASIKTYLEKD